MQAQPTAPIHGPIVPNPPSFQSNGILTPEEFENLKRQIQLLRISQLRYIVKKYELPASGNKTRLVQIVLHLFDAMRNTTLLSSINAEVLNIISSFHEPFTNPLEKTHKLFLQKPESLQNVEFRLSFHPFIRYPFIYDAENTLVPAPPLLGPIYVLPGISSGKFSFSIESLLRNKNDQNENINNNADSKKSNDINDNKEENTASNNDAENNNTNNQEQQINSNTLDFKICIDFAWPNGEVSPFEMIACMNCAQIIVSNDDPSPLPLDITDCCKISSQSNAAASSNLIIEFKSVQTKVPMTISIKQYELSSMSSVAANILNVEENALEFQGNLKQPLPMNDSIQNWMQDYAKRVYTTK